jgi:hypothetical protein
VIVNIEDRLKEIEDKDRLLDTAGRVSGDCERMFCKYRSYVYCREKLRPVE